MGDPKLALQKNLLPSGCALICAIKALSSGSAPSTITLYLCLSWTSFSISSPELEYLRAVDLRVTQAHHSPRASSSQKPSWTFPTLPGSILFPPELK